MQMMHSSSSSSSPLSALSSCPTSLTSSMIQTLEGRGAKISISFFIKYCGRSITISFHCLPPISRSYTLHKTMRSAHSDLVKNVFGCFGPDFDSHNQQRKHEASESEACDCCQIENLRARSLAMRFLAKYCYHILRGESFPPGDFEAHRGENETEKDEEEEEASNDLHDASCHG